jgi:hypothetical protein
MQIYTVYFQIHHPHSTTKDFGIKKKWTARKMIQFLLQLHSAKTPQISAQQKLYPITYNICAVLTQCCSNY